MGCETSDTLTVLIPDDPNIQITFSDTIVKGMMQNLLYIQSQFSIGNHGYYPKWSNH